MIETMQRQATKRVGSSGSEMFDPIIHLDGKYRVPNYKLSEKQIDELHADEYELQLFRATKRLRAACIGGMRCRKRFMSDPRVADMEAYLLDLRRPLRDRTNEAAIAVGMAFPAFTVDVTSPCVYFFKARRKGRTAPDRTPQCVAEEISKRIEEVRHNHGWNESGMDRGSGAAESLPVQRFYRILSDAHGTQPSRRKKKLGSDR